MAGSGFRLRAVVVHIHYLAECPACGTIASVLMEPKENMLERKIPTCRKCRARMDPEPSTVHARVRIEECR